MSENSGMNRAKFYQLALFPMNNGATNVYFVLILSYVAMFGENILGLIGFASVMVTAMRLFDAVTDPIIGSLMDKTNTKFGKFRPFMVIGNIIMAASVIVLYVFTPAIPATMKWARYLAFTVLSRHSPATASSFISPRLWTLNLKTLLPVWVATSLPLA